MTVRLLPNENLPRPAPVWPAETVLAMLNRSDFVAGHLVVITGQSVRRRALPSAPVA